MDERGRHQTGDDATTDDEAVAVEDAETAVRVHESRPGRVVFTVRGNTDAWIASDLAVDPDP